MEEVLQIGSEGENVRQLQAQLNAEGYEIQVDSIFGEETRTAVIDFQKSNGLETDGIVGPKTASRLGIEELLSMGSEGLGASPGDIIGAIHKNLTQDPTPTPTPTPTR